MSKKNTVKRNQVLARQRVISVTITMLLISIIAVGVLIGVSSVSGERPEPEEPVLPGVDVTPPDISLISVIQFDSRELADANTRGKVLSPKNEGSKQGVGGVYETRPGKVVRITVSVTDYGKGFAAEDVIFWVGSASSVMEQESGSVFHFDFQRDETGVYGINVVATDYEDNEGKLWAKSGKIEVRNAPTSPSKKKGRGTKKDPVTVDPVRYQYYEKNGKYYCTDGNRAVHDKGRRGDGKPRSYFDLGYLYMRYVDKKWYDAEGNFKREERIVWWDGEGKRANDNALEVANKAYDATTDPAREKQLQRQIDERSQRKYVRSFGGAEFTLYNINSW